MRSHTAIKLKKSAVWLAEELALDCLENSPYAAMSWATVGFFTYEEEEAANTWVDQGGRATRKECWAVPKEGCARRRIVMITKIDPMASQLLPGTRIKVR